MVEETPTYPVIPVIYGDDVICSCGANMEPWSYTAFPSRRKQILWRCWKGHTTSMVPLPKDNQ